MKLFCIFLIIFCISSTVSGSYSIKPSIDDQKLPKSICKIINDVTNSKTDTQDILIGSSGGKVQSSTINDIIECIDDKNAVVLTDLRTKVAEKTLRKATVIILELRSIRKVSRIVIYGINQAGVNA